MVSSSIANILSFCFHYSIESALVSLLFLYFLIFYGFYWIYGVFMAVGIVFVVILAYNGHGGSVWLSIITVLAVMHSCHIVSACW